MEIAFVILYFTVLLALCTLGFHRAHLVCLCFKHRAKLGAQPAAPTLPEGELPFVTVQLPTFNEATVVARLIEAAGRLEYPRDRFEIQVLDDSTDETRSIAEKSVQRLRASGVSAHYERRPGREGYKAGALEWGLKTARGELIAIFDADFIPQPDFLQRVVGYFSDSQVGMVQTRWGHMNREASFLTSIQALMLDGHHLVENRARFGAGLFFNFSGTGGMWRREAIDAAGGWQHDTLTEDLDLSYRAQLKGYRFVYCPDVVTPSELPEDMSAFRAQQHRWAKGTVQTARKLLPTVLRAPLGRGQRLEACFHMLPHMAYPLMVLLTVLLLPALLALPAADVSTMLLVDLPLCLGATGSLGAFYATAEIAQGRSAWSAIKRLPLLIALGAGLAPHLSRAVWSGYRSMAGEFVRTPKRGGAAGRYWQVADLPLPEVLLCLLCAGTVVASITTEHWFALPFATLFMLGYGGVAALVVGEQLRARRQSMFPVPREAMESQQIARAA